MNPSHPPSNMRQLGIHFGWIPSWQLSLNYSNLATELLSESVFQLVRAWQAICQVVRLSSSLTHCLFPPLSSFLTFLSQ